MIKIEATVSGDVTKSGVGYGYVFRRDSLGYMISFLNPDRSFIILVTIPFNLIAGSYAINQSVAYDLGGYSVADLQKAAALFIDIPPDPPDSVDLESFGTSCDHNVQGNVIVSSVRPFTGSFEFSCQNERMQNITVFGRYAEEYEAREFGNDLR